MGSVIGNGPSILKTASDQRGLLSEPRLLATVTCDTLATGEELVSDFLCQHHKENDIQEPLAGVTDTLQTS